MMEQKSDPTTRRMLCEGAGTHGHNGHATVKSETSGKPLAARNIKCLGERPGISPPSGPDRGLLASWAV